MFQNACGIEYIQIGELYYGVHTFSHPISFEYLKFIHMLSDEVQKFQELRYSSVEGNVLTASCVYIL